MRNEARTTPLPMTPVSVLDKLFLPRPLMRKPTNGNIGMSQAICNVLFIYPCYRRCGEFCLHLLRCRFFYLVKIFQLKNYLLFVLSKIAFVLPFAVCCILLLYFQLSG